MLHVLHPGHLRFFLLVPFALAAVLIELVWRLAIARKGYDTKAAAATLGVALGHSLFEGASAIVVVAIMGLVAQLSPLHWPLQDWRTWVVGFFVVEFAYYWYHRLSHRVRWLWATHVVHHTSEEITLLSAIRLGWTNLLSCGWMVYLPVVLLGFDPRLVFLILAVDLRYQFLLHTEAKINLGPLEWVLNTPAHHQVHHASNPAYLDKNYGGAVIIFDRLFDTFAKARPDDPLRYGLVHRLGTQNPVVLALGEWRRLLVDLSRARSPAGASRIAFGPPV